MQNLENTLFYGDNLEVLAKHVPDGTIDLVYLDPPFNSNRDYNVLFKEQSGKESPAQIKAFGDTWNWAGAASVWDEFAAVCPNDKVIDLMSGFVHAIGRNDVTAYLVMMAPRLYHLHRVLKPTGSLYLHCDPTASAYLRLLLDALFGGQNFKNEIIWKRTSSKGLTSRRMPSNHDVVFCYQVSNESTWNIEALFDQYDLGDLDDKTAEKYSQKDELGRLYQLTSLVNPNTNRPNLTYEFLGVTRVWRWTKERMQAAYEAGLVIQPGPGKVPRFKRYLDEQRGRPIGDVWADIPPINSQAAERLGYPTQKPLALLERIISASSNPGDVVLDPFCGCGTAIVAAQKLGRRWVGIDVTPIATSLIQKRLFDAFGSKDARLKSDKDPALAPTFNVEGLPTDTAGAQAMFEADHKKFEMWAVGLVPAIPQEKKGADGGIDGLAYFHDGGKSPSKAVVQVKGGHVTVSQLRDLRGVKDREKAALALFVCLDDPTKAMRDEALSAGFYQPLIGGKKVAALQMRTIADLLGGKAFDLPFSQANVSYQKAQAVTPDSGQGGLEF